MRAIARWLIEEIEAVTPSWGEFNGRHYTVKNYDPVWRDDIFHLRKLAPTQQALVEVIGRDALTRGEIDAALKARGWKPSENGMITNYLTELVSFAFLDCRSVRRNGRITKVWCRPSTEIQ